MSTKPNILFLMTDQQRPDSLGCYGSREALTPNLDSLASDGVLFENCYVQNPLCCPSRYSILTGRYPHCHGVVSNWYAPRPGEISFGHQLKRAGYRTALIGKMHFTPWQDCFGFDGRIIAEAKFDDQCPDDYERFLNKHGLSRRDLYDLSSDAYIQNATAIRSVVPQDLHIDSFVGRSICEYLERTSDQVPFCLFGSFLSPHNPYAPPSPYDSLFLSKTLPARNIGAEEVAKKPREAYDYINSRLGWPYRTDQLTDEQIHQTKAYYYSLNTLVDDWIGRIVSMLKKKGLYDNTVIVYTSDHGDLLGDHGLVYKQCFYEQSVRVPLIIHAPQRFQARRVTSPVESIDLFNTFCDLGQVWPGQATQGKSLLPLLEESKDGQHREAVFSENYFGKMIRCDDWKLVYYTGKPYGELYHLGSDPDEQINLWTELDGSPIKNRLKDLLLEWLAPSEDPMPQPVRQGHYDRTPRQHEPYCGGTRESAVQPWFLQDCLDLYQDWNYSDSGKLRA